MAGLTFTKRQLEQVIEVLNADHEDVGAAAKAVLATAEEIIQARSQFVVVGQVVATKEKGKIAASDPDATKVALGFYATAGDAQRAAESLWSSTSSGDSLRCWVLPTFFGSPHEWHGGQKAKYDAAELKRKQGRSDKLMAQIQKRRKEAQERADNMRDEGAAA